MPLASTVHWHVPLALRNFGRGDGLCIGTASGVLCQCRERCAGVSLAIAGVGETVVVSARAWSRRSLMRRQRDVVRRVRSRRYPHRATPTCFAPFLA